MNRQSTLTLTAGALLVAMLSGATAAAQKTSCPAGEWRLWAIESDAGASPPVLGVADYFWPHLLNDLYGFADAAEFAQVLEDLYDKNGDGMVCGFERGGYDLNPKSHWYRYGMEAIGEPVHYLTVKDNAANGRT
jgi:hypothetical protein